MLNERMKLLFIENYLVVRLSERYEQFLEREQQLDKHEDRLEQLHSLNVMDYRSDIHEQSGDHLDQILKKNSFEISSHFKN